MFPPINLELYEKRIYSQNGEDGITMKLIETLILPYLPKSKWDSGYFVEFGVEQGTECNTRIIRENYGWNGLHMDCCYENPSANLHKEYITRENIVALFEKYGVPAHIQVLSVDIDYNDFYVLYEILQKYECDIIICEYNATHLPDNDCVVRYDEHGSWDYTNYFGASLLAYYKLGRYFGYSLVYCESNGVNYFLVNDDVLKKTGVTFINMNKVAKLYRPPKYGVGPNGGHSQDPHNRSYVSSGDILYAGRCGCG